MIMTREYYNNNVDMAIEVEDEYGHRMWVDCKGSALDSTWEKYKKRGYSFSDEDLCCTQSDEKVRHFLNVVDYNSNHNPNYKGLGFHKVLELALDKWDL